MKKIIALLLVLAMALSLAACGNKPVEDDGTATVTMIAAQYGNETAAWWADFEAKIGRASCRERV